MTKDKLGDLKKAYREWKCAREGCPHTTHYCQYCATRKRQVWRALERYMGGGKK